MSSARSARLALAAVASALGAGSAHAQEAGGYGASARVARDAFDGVRSEGHVDRDERDRAAAGSVGDALEQADAVVVQRTSSASAAPIVRGLTGYRVLLLADELRLNDSLTRPGGSALLNLVDPESVARIEVVRGPASVVYGSDALGGVVRVVTHRTGARADGSRDLSATVYTRGASAERAVRAQAGVHGVAGGLGARLSFGAGHTGALLRGAGLGEQPFTGHDDWSLAARLELVPARGQRLWLAHQSGHLLDAPRTDVSAPGDRQIVERLDREQAVLGYTGSFPALNVTLRAYAGMTLRREWRRRIRELETSDERDRVLGYHAGVSAVAAPLAGASLEAGAEAVLEDIGSAAATADETGTITRGRGRYLDGSRYDTYALYALWTHGLDERWSALAGARGTLVDARAPVDPLFDPELGARVRLDRTLPGAVGSLGVRWDATSALSWSASLLGGYRAPNLEDFQALGGGARGFTIPNPDLDEERSWTLETGVKLDDARWRASAFLFASLLTGLIERVPASFDGMTEIDGARVQTPDNASRSVLLGSELSLLHRHAWGLYGGMSAHATWGQTVRPDQTGADVEEPASKVPPPTGALQLGFEPDAAPYWLQAALHFALPQTRLSASDRADVRICEQGPDGCDHEPGWTDLTLRAGARVGSWLTLAAGVENLLDTGYKTFASGAYAPGRNFTLAMRGTL